MPRKPYRTPDLPDETPVLINRFINRLNELKESDVSEVEKAVKNSIAMLADRGRSEVINHYVGNNRDFYDIIVRRKEKPMTDTDDHMMDAMPYMSEMEKKTKEAFQVKAGETYDFIYPGSAKVRSYKILAKNDNGHWQGICEGHNVIGGIEFYDDGTMVDGRKGRLKPRKPRHKVVEWIAEEKNTLVFDDDNCEMMVLRTFRDGMYRIIARIPYGNTEFYEGEGLD